ncbi:hypothetical protein MLD38_007369 [Melastoma candidum]|uniref:Uncharacterized protein n=1 Tax=Melastoma candidum TaxID=119954 RepID=A0ACB9RQM0_9MYRT|nr:hypothetical protein MLD38_007369 [Melastoma candidum]
MRNSASSLLRQQHRTITELKRGPWTPDEDSVLVDYIARNGEGNWRTLPKRAGLLRCGKSCRLRWMNYLRPSVKRGRIEADEEDLILRLHRLLGNRWSLIAGRIPGRTDNEIKNYWNSHLRKKLISQGIDPKTHLPVSEAPVPSLRRYRDIQNSDPIINGQNGCHGTHNNNNECLSTAGGSEIASVDVTLGDEEVGDAFSSFLNSLMNDEAPFACQNQAATPPPPSNSGFGHQEGWGTW